MLNVERMFASALFSIHTQQSTAFVADAAAVSVTEAAMGFRRKIKISPEHPETETTAREKVSQIVSILLLLVLFSSTRLSKQICRIQ